MSSYKLIILRKSLLFQLLSKNLNKNSTWQYRFVEKSVKLFDKSVHKNDFLKINNL